MDIVAFVRPQGERIGFKWRIGAATLFTIGALSLTISAVSTYPAPQHPGDFLTWIRGFDAFGNGLTAALFWLSAAAQKKRAAQETSAGDGGK